MFARHDVAATVEFSLAHIHCRVSCPDDATAVRVHARLNGAPPPVDDPPPFPEPIELRVHEDVLVGRWREFSGTVHRATSSVTTTGGVHFTDALVRVAVAERLAQVGGLLLHASAVLHRGQAAVCFGASGVGKSTVAAAFAPALCDEVVAITPEPSGGFRVHGTPWWHGSPVSAPLGRLVWLVRGEAPSCVPVQGLPLVRAISHESRRYVPELWFLGATYVACAALADVGAVRLAAAEGAVVASLRKVLE